MVAKMARNLVVQKAALWALHSAASLACAMVAQWELSTVAHSADHLEGLTVECLAHSKVGGWASLTAEQMVSQMVAPWDASMVDR